MTGRGLDHPYFALPRPWLIAHRGGSLEAPENTLEAFDHAAALGVDAIETDVRLSKDGEVMVFHDADTARITGVPGSIEDRTLAEIQQLDAGWSYEQPRGKHPWRGKGVRIPRLADALARHPGIRFNIEAKGKGRRLAERLAQVLEAAGRQEMACVGAEKLLQSWRLARLLPRYARFLNGWAAGRHYLAARVPILSFLGWRAHDLAALPTRMLGQDLASDRVIAHFHDRRMAVQYWTIDDEQTMRDLLGRRADGIMSDVPTLLKQVLGR